MQTNRPTLMSLKTRRYGIGLYVMTMSVSLLVAATGLTLIAIQRADRRLQNNIALDDKLYWSARSGLELVLILIENTSNWRQLMAAGNFLAGEFPVGESTCSVEFFDDQDGNIADDDSEPVRAVVTAMLDGADYQSQAELKPRPHPVLAYSFFSGNQVNLTDDTTIKGPVYAQSSISQGGSRVRVMTGASFTVVNGGTISSSLTPKYYLNAAINPPAVNMSFYLNLATPINGVLDGDKRKLVNYNLSPISNPEGSPNPNGIYSLNACGLKGESYNCNIQGTLIIHNTQGKEVTFNDGCQIKPGPLGYPVLLVENSSCLKFDPNYQVGYVRGIIWNGTGEIRFQDNFEFTGCALSPTKIETRNFSVIGYDPALQYMLLPGFVDTGIRIVRSSYREAALDD